jgi:hypothetical protein
MTTKCDICDDSIPLLGGSTLVIQYGKSPFLRGKSSNSKWPFSIAILVYWMLFHFFDTQIHVLYL